MRGCWWSIGPPASLQHHHIRDLPALLRPGDCLVINDTRVIPARLVGFRDVERRPLGGAVSLGRRPGQLAAAGQNPGQTDAGRATSRWSTSGCKKSFGCGCVLKEPDGAWIARPEADGQRAWSCLEQVGRVPLPPYIRDGEMVEADRERYQTVYAESPGAVAAPTAGLHFTRRSAQAAASGRHRRSPGSRCTSGSTRFGPMTAADAGRTQDAQRMVPDHARGRGHDRAQQGGRRPHRGRGHDRGARAGNGGRRRARWRRSRARPTCSSVRRTRFARSTPC